MVLRRTCVVEHTHDARSAIRRRPELNVGCDLGNMTGVHSDTEEDVGEGRRLVLGGLKFEPQHLMKVTQGKRSSRISIFRELEIGGAVVIVGGFLRDRQPATGDLAHEERVRVKLHTLLRCPNV